VIWVWRQAKGAIPPHGTREPLPAKLLSGFEKAGPLASGPAAPSHGDLVIDVKRIVPGSNAERSHQNLRGGGIERGAPLLLSGHRFDFRNGFRATG
jgi:hypothetical protein